MKIKEITIYECIAFIDVDSLNDGLTILFYNNTIMSTPD